jgi:hypothetical protein
MVRVSTPVKAVLNDPELSLARAPFREGVVIKRSSYDSGEYPEHLRQFAIQSGECAGLTGTEVYNGTEIPATAACVARKA